MARTSVFLLALILLAATAAGRVLLEDSKGSKRSSTADDEEVLVNLLLADAKQQQSGGGSSACPEDLVAEQQSVVEDVVHNFFRYGYCTLRPAEQYVQLASTLKYQFSKAVQAYVIRNDVADLPQECNFRDSVDDVMGGVKAALDGDSVCGDADPAVPNGGDLADSPAPAPGPSSEVEA